MQARGRGGGGTHRAAVGVDGLVAVGIIYRLQPAFLAGLDDVRRQRQLAGTLREARDGQTRGQREADEVLALLRGHHDRGHPVDREARGVGGALAGTQQAPPLLRSGRRPQQQAFDLTAGGADPEEPGLEHGDIVAEERGADRQQVREVGEDAVLDCARRAVDDEQTGGVATHGGHRRDALRGQVEIQLPQIHGSAAGLGRRD